MSQLTVQNKVLRPGLQSLGLLLVLLVSGAFPAAATAEDTFDGLSVLAENPVIDSGVLSALEEDGAASVVITFDLPPIENSRYAHHPAAKTDVHPLVFDMVASAEPGTVRFEEAGPSFVLQARMSVAALRALGDNPDILAIELDPNPVVPDTPASGKQPVLTSKVHCPCTPLKGSTVGCFHSGKWAMTVVHGGSNSRVAAYSDISAAFWTYGSTNWEILGKVINGCAVNNRWWVFVSGASSNSFTVTVAETDFCPNYKTYSSASSGNPVLDTSAFPCS